MARVLQTKFLDLPFYGGYGLCRGWERTYVSVQERTRVDPRFRGMTIVCCLPGCCTDGPLRPSTAVTQMDPRFRGNDGPCIGGVRSCVSAHDRNSDGSRPMLE